MKNKVAIVIASRSYSNPYIKKPDTKNDIKYALRFYYSLKQALRKELAPRKFYHDSKSRNIGDFLPINYPHDFFVLGGSEIYGQNFEKWNTFLKEHNDYEYYMLLHDDCYEFAKGWLDFSIGVSKKYKDNVIVCHQNYSSKGTPGFCYLSGVKTKTNIDEHLSLNDPILIDAMNKFFKKPLLKGVDIKYHSVIGGESCLMSNKIALKLLRHGGIPYPKKNEYEHGFKWTPVYERIFSCLVTSLDIKIIDRKINGEYIFKHNTLV